MDLDSLENLKDATVEDMRIVEKGDEEMRVPTGTPDGSSWMSFLYRQDEEKRRKPLRKPLRSWWD